MTLLIVIIVLALIFDYINGFHDAANSIATIVATKVLTPFQAVFWAAFFNFLAYWVFGFGVADTVAKTAKTDSINLTVILAGVIAAIVWNLITWWKGIPSSSSHTLIGGFAGAAIAHGFSGVVQDPEHYGLKIVSWFKAAKEGELLPSGVLIVILFIVIAPLLGMIISYFISLWTMYSSKKNIFPKLLTLVLMGLAVWFLSTVQLIKKIYKKKIISLDTNLFGKYMYSRISFYKENIIFLKIIKGEGTMAQNAVVLANAAAALFATHKYANYEDAYAALRRWHSAGIPLYVYSSGSVPAQKLFFAHTDHGDLCPLFTGHYDTEIGGKREAGSYGRIAGSIGFPPENLLFLSDIVEELDAARDAGWQTMLIDRREDYPQARTGDAAHGHARAERFSDISAL